MNDSRQMVRDRKTGARGFVVSQDGNRYNVALPDGQNERRQWFAEEELEFLPRPSASEINEAFGKQLKDKMDKTSSAMTSGSEQKLGRVPKPKNRD